MCFCMYCTSYRGLDELCEQGVKITNIKDVMECQDYNYNGETNG